MNECKHTCSKLKNKKTNSPPQVCWGEGREGEERQSAELAFDLLINSAVICMQNTEGVEAAGRNAVSLL